MILRNEIDTKQTHLLGRKLGIQRKTKQFTAGVVIIIITKLLGTHHGVETDKPQKQFVREHCLQLYRARSMQSVPVGLWDKCSDPPAHNVPTVCHIWNQVSVLLEILVCTRVKTNQQMNGSSDGKTVKFNNRILMWKSIGHGWVWSSNCYVDGERRHKHTTNLVINNETIGFYKIPASIKTLHLHRMLD